MDRYATLGDPETLVKNSVRYTVQRYQGEHENEFLLRSETGDMFLYENNVLKQQWQENGKGVKSDEFIAYKNGRVDFRQRFEDILEQRDFNCIVNHKKGLRMEIWSSKTGHLIYHGGFKEKRQKEGWGIEYDEDSGKVVVEGIYDEDTETFVREGKGCLIDEKTGIATRECEWKDGREVSGVDLNDGWYNLVPLHINVSNPIDLENLSLEVTDLTICSNCCNDLTALDLNRFEWLRSIKIGDDCFSRVQTFKMDGLNRLESLKIGKNSFTQILQEEWKVDLKGAETKANVISKSFLILNCESLKSIEIGEFSFSDFGGDFELKNLPALQSIQIGKVGSNSFNFDINRSLMIRGTDMI